jgi:conjugal transfer/entry exclusion protein
MTAYERATELVERLMRDQCQAQETALREWDCIQCAEQRIADAIAAAETEARQEAERERDRWRTAFEAPADRALADHRAAESLASAQALKAIGERDEARSEAGTNRAKYEGALNAIPVVVAKETERLKARVLAAESALASAREALKAAERLATVCAVDRIYRYETRDVCDALRALGVLK